MVSERQNDRTYQVWLPQSLAHAVQLLLGGADHGKVLANARLADQVTHADVRLEGLGVEAGNNWLDKVRAES